MDLSKFSTGEKITVVGAIIALISSFLPWYSLPVVSYFGVTAGVGGSVSLWTMHGFAGFLVLIGAVVAIAVILLRVFEVFDISEQNVPEPMVVLVAAVVSVLGGLWGLLSTNGWGRSWGMWVGLIGIVIFIIGAVMKFQEERA